MPAPICWQAAHRMEDRRQDRQQWKDASGDIAIAWPAAGGPVLVCACTQGGSPTPKQFEVVFVEIGRVIDRRLG